MSELQDPDTVEGSAGDQPCRCVELKITGEGLLYGEKGIMEIT